MIWLNYVLGTYCILKVLSFVMFALSD